MKKENSVTTNPTGQDLVPVPLRVNPETIENNMIAGKKVVYRKIGGRRYPCIIEMVPQEAYDTYMQIEWADVKAEEREARCLIPKKGGFIMCPECNKCSSCIKSNEWKFDNCHPVHIEALTIEDDDEEIGVKSDVTNDGSDMMAEEIATMIEEELRKIRPKYAVIFREMFEGNFKPSDIAKRNNLRVSTTYEDVPKVMAEAQKIFALLLK